MQNIKHYMGGADRPRTLGNKFWDVKIIDSLFGGVDVRISSEQSPVFSINNLIQSPFFSIS